MVLSIAFPREVLYTGFLVPIVAVVIIGFSGSHFDIYTIKKEELLKQAEAEGK